MKLTTLILVLIALLLYGKFVKGYSFTDMLSPKKWKSVFISLLKKLLLKLDGTSQVVPLYVAEQYVYRELVCPDCVIATKCVHCHCDTEDKMTVATETCSSFKWFPEMNKEDWSKFKLNNNINFRLR